MNRVHELGWRIALLLVAIAFHGCGKSKVQDDGAPCESSVDCPTGACIGGTCRAGPSDNPWMSPMGSPTDTTDAGTGTPGPGPGTGSTDGGSALPGIDGGTSPTDPGGNGPDGGPIEPPVEVPPASRLQLPELFEARAASVLGEGVLVVGMSEHMLGQDDTRNAGLLYLGPDGEPAWMKVVAAPSNEQLFGIAQRAQDTMAAGLTKSFSVTASLNDDVWLVRPSPTGELVAWNFGTGDHEHAFGIAAGPGSEAWLVAGLRRIGTPGERNGFVMAVDETMTPLWGLDVGTAYEDQLYSIATDGDLTLAVGETYRADGTRDGWLVGIRDGALAFSSRVGGGGDDSLHFVRYLPGEGFLVTGSYRETIDSVSYAFLAMVDPTGAITSYGLVNAGRYTRLTYAEVRGDELHTAGYFSEDTVFLARLRKSDFRPLAFSHFDQFTIVSWLSAPVVTKDRLSHLLAQAPDGLVHLPFADGTRAGCDGQPISAVTDARTLDVTPLAVDTVPVELFGGPIAAMPVVDGPVSTAPMDCQAP